MKIYSAEQLKEADRLTMERQQISSTDLMERAATQVFEEIHKRLEGADIPVKIFCGTGNNGGDGLVIGRLLMEQGYNVTIYVVNYSDRRSQDFLTNYERVRNLSRNWPILIREDEDIPALSKGDFIIDAIFGIGLNRPLSGWVAKLVSKINTSGAFILAIDLPSGVIADGPLAQGSETINASYTITFQAPKLSFFLPETANSVGELQVIDIGLDRDFLRETRAIAELIGKQEAKIFYRPRNRFSHKGDFGHALMVGGSHGKIGSICLSATAALKSGSGLVTGYIPACGYEIFQSTSPEAMVLTDRDLNKITEIVFSFDPDVVSFGVGTGTDPETVKGFGQLLKMYDRPMVIDADGLNILAEHKELWDHLPEASILTPHPGELKRLTGSWKEDMDKLEKARGICRDHNLIMVIKGAYTTILTSNDTFINTSGNPGMATAGSGDVLTGIITSFLGQGYSPLSAAILGVFLHGRAGDLAANDLSFEGLTARDICNYLGLAILDLFKEPTPPNRK